MKVLLLCKCSPWKEGGAETRTREVALQLASMGCEITVLCAKTDAWEPEYQEVNGVRIFHKKILPDWVLRRFPYPSYVSLAVSSVMLMFFLRKLLTATPFDVLREDISPFPPSGLLALMKLPVGCRVAVVHNLENHLRGWLRYYGLAQGLAGFAMSRLLCRGKLRYDRIICDSKWFAEELRRQPRISSKVLYIPNGAWVDSFKIKTPPAANPPAIHLLSVGRLVKIKGHGTLIDAVALLRDEFPPLRLDILGNGPLKRALIRRAARQGVSGRLFFREPVKHDEMPEIYAAYDFFVLPSFFEGLPVVLLEAMAAKLPVVASKIPGVEDVVDVRSATLFLPGDAEDLARKLKWAIRNPAEIVEKAESAYRIVRQYQWNDIARKEMEASLPS